MFCACCTTEDQSKDVFVITDQAKPGLGGEADETRDVEQSSELDIAFEARGLAVEIPGAMEPVAPPTATEAVWPPPEPALNGLGPLTTREFAIQIDKEGGSLGIDISMHDGLTLLIGKIKDGPVEKWNQQVGLCAYERVRRGDRIIECNGVSDNSDGIMTVLKSDAVLNLKIRRIAEFRVVIRGRAELGRQPGLEVEESRVDKLIVKDVSDGPIQDLNKKNKADMEIRPGDEIADVNGATGDAKTLFDIIQTGGPVQLLVRRPDF